MRLRGFSAVATFALAATLTGMAQPSQASTQAQQTNEPPRQPQAAGRYIDIKFTRAQQQGMASLEKEVKNLVTKFHGTRKSINEVEWENGKVVEILPLPTGLEALNSAPVSTVKGGVSAQGTIAPMATLYSYGCAYSTSGTYWSCIYEHINFNGLQQSSEPPGNGRLLKFQQAGVVQDLAAYNFRDQTSSWNNNTANLVKIGNISSGGNCKNAPELWREQPNSLLGFVGATKNDKADCIFINGLW